MLRCWFDIEGTARDVGKDRNRQRDRDRERFYLVSEEYDLDVEALIWYWGYS